MKQAIWPLLIVIYVGILATWIITRWPSPAEADILQQRIDRVRSEERQREEEFIRRKRMGRWPWTSESTCNSQTTEPSICIALLDTGPFRSGNTIIAKVHWANVTAPASYAIYLERNLDSQDGRAYVGPDQAPLMMHTVPVSASGSHEFRWDGKYIACATSDIHRECKSSATRGEYVLRIALFHTNKTYTDESFSGIQAIFRQQPSTNLLLKHAKTRPFQLDAEPDLRPLAQTMYSAALDKLFQDNRGSISSSALSGDFNGSAVHPQRSWLFWLCGDVPAKKPYSGSYRACIPRDKVFSTKGILLVEPEDIDMTGSIHRE